MAKYLYRVEYASGNTFRELSFKSDEPPPTNPRGWGAEGRIAGFRVTNSVGTVYFINWHQIVWMSVSQESR